MGIENKFILISGLMGSGKSTIINEFIIERNDKLEEFTRPPVEAKFRGMNFEFVDQIFALKKDSSKFNFYELDAPTINKWTQFIEIADSVIVVYNTLKKEYFESPEQFIENIKKYTNKNAPIFFIVNGVNSDEEAEEQLKEFFDLSILDDHQTDIRGIPKVEQYVDDEYGLRRDVDISILDNLYDDVINSLVDK